MPLAPALPAPPHGYIPTSTAAKYVQRGIEDKVRARLLSRDGVAAIVSVYAPGGVGKSELAKQVDAQLKPRFGETFWINCNDKNPNRSRARSLWRSASTFRRTPLTRSGWRNCKPTSRSTAS